MDPILARKLARTANPYPSIVFFAPEVTAAYAAAGLPEGHSGYFAGRAAPLGPVPAEVVVATFYNFQPALVRSVIPAAWSYASPSAILEHRLAAVDRGIRRVLGDDVASSALIREAAGLARTAAEACTPEARALYAAHASLAWPTEPHLQLWHALTLLREFRGDGHLIALQVAGYSGCEALVMHQAVAELPGSLFKTRNWSPEQWAASANVLRSRGLVEADGNATEAGRASRAAVEHQTDLLDLAPLAAIGPDGAERLRDILRPMSRAIVAAVYPAVR